MPPDEIDANLPQLAQISRAISHVYKVKLGRGPTACTVITPAPTPSPASSKGRSPRSSACCLRVEEHERLRDIRLLVQDAVRPELCEVVERVTGRTVVTCTSGFDSRADVASENFQLAPA